jgi:hypothetical protein
MKTVAAFSLALAFAAVPFAAAADDDDDDRRGKRHGRGEYKQEYWDGACKIERKFKKNGDYKEKRKCKGGGEPHVVYMQPQPVYVPAPQPVYLPAPVIVQPGIVIQGSVRLP